MRREIARFPMSEEASLYMQRLQFDMDGLRVLNTQLIRSGVESNERYEKFLEEYREAYAEYYLAFNELCREILPLELQGSMYSKYINFVSDEMIVVEEEGCSCER